MTFEDPTLLVLSVGSNDIRNRPGAEIVEKLTARMVTENWKRLCAMHWPWVAFVDSPEVLRVGVNDPQPDCLFRARRLPPQRGGRTGHGPGTEECHREHPNEGFSEEGLRSPGTCSGRSDTVANATFSPTMPATSWLRGVSTILSTTSRKRSRNPHQHAKRGRLNELSSSQRLLE